jgi:type IV secretory pathway VirB4 component
MISKPLPKQILKPTLPNIATPKPIDRQSGKTILLGENIYWDLAKVPNPHMVILGTSGSGKTQTLKAIAGELYHSFPSQSIVLDFHGDQQLPGETYYPLNMASDYGINPLTINPDPEGG